MIVASDKGIFTFTTADAEREVIFVKSQAVVANIEEGHCSQHPYYANGCSDCMAASYVKTFDSTEFEKRYGQNHSSAKMLWKGNFLSPLKIQIESPNPKFQLIRQQMARALAIFFAKEKRKAATAATKKVKELTKALTENQRIAVAYAAWKSIEWVALIDVFETDLLASAQAGAFEGLAQLGISDTTIENEVIAKVQEYAKDRAAEMIGMRFIGEKLVEDSSAKFVIAETTKNDLEDVIEQVFDKNETIEQMRERIISAATFSDVRSQFIAKNEDNMAHVFGHLTAWRESNSIKLVNIVLSDLHAIYDECDELVAGNPYPIHSVPLIPSHPNCVCSISAVQEE
jgi:hypothetical protein